MTTKTTTVYRATCDEFDDHSTGYHTTEEAAVAAFWNENWFTEAERARVNVYTLAEDAHHEDTASLAKTLSDMGSPSPALGIGAR
jgi:hypothetical protein